VISVILDASALLAMIKNEPGGDRVAKVMSEARINAINFAEVVSHFDFLGTPPEQIDAMLTPLSVEVAPADRELATLAGKLRAATAAAGLSLGDRFCLAQALRDGLPAWTADRSWVDVAETVGVDVVLIR
jgi:PIN domain nuclease of toxin-antitoxin system